MARSAIFFSAVLLIFVISSVKALAPSGQFVSYVLHESARGYTSSLNSVGKLRNGVVPLPELLSFGPWSVRGFGLDSANGQIVGSFASAVNYQQRLVSYNFVRNTSVTVDIGSFQLATLDLAAPLGKFFGLGASILSTSYLSLFSVDPKSLALKTIRNTTIPSPTTSFRFGPYAALNPIQHTYFVNSGNYLSGNSVTIVSLTDGSSARSQIPTHPYLQSIFYDPKNNTFFGIAQSNSTVWIASANAQKGSVRLSAPIASAQSIQFGDARFSPQIRSVIAQCGKQQPTESICSINVDTGAYQILWPATWEGSVPIFVPSA
jgi:hypothetical protein